MKKSIIILSLVLFALPATAQELFVESGISIAQFDYQDSANNELSNLQAKTLSYFNLGTRLPLLEKKLQFLGSAVFHRYGAVGSDNSVQNYFEWETSYLGLHVGLDSQLFHAGAFSFHINAGVGIEFIIQGTQTLNNAVFNVVGNDDFKGPIAMFRVGGSLEYLISPNTAITFNYRYGKSGQVGSSSEALKYQINQIGLGLQFTLNSGQSQK